MRVIYSKKRDEILIEHSSGHLEDFAENTWSKNNKFFKAIFGPCVALSTSKKGKKAKGKENVQNK